MILSKNIKKDIFLASTIFLLLACLLIGIVAAQGGGGGPLILDPESGPAGVQVEVTMNVTDYLVRTSLTDYAYLYHQLSYSLVLDLGDQNTPPSLDTVRNATWRVIGQAAIYNGQLHGVATIPDGTPAGEHLITAVYYDQHSDAPYNYFWEYFTVKSEDQLRAMLPDWLVYLIVVIVGITVSVALILYYRTRRGHAT